MSPARIDPSRRLALSSLITSAVAVGFASGVLPGIAAAADKGNAAAPQLARESLAALNKLYASVPAAKALGPKAHAILVFPSITKAGLGIGGQYGEGALIQKGKAVATLTTANKKAITVRFTMK